MSASGKESVCIKALFKRVHHDHPVHDTGGDVYIARSTDGLLLSS